MNPTVVGDDIGDREDSRVAFLGQDVDADPGQSTPRSDEPVVYAIHPAQHRADAGQVQFGYGSAGQYAGLRAGCDEVTDRSGGQLHIGVEVDPREGPAVLIAEAQGVRLAADGRFHDAYAGGPSGVGGLVMAAVGDDDDVEFTRSGSVEQPSQARRDDGFLVVRRHDDAHRGRGPGRVRVGRRLLTHVDHRCAFPSSPERNVHVLLVFSRGEREARL
jgi:hypothetical protein